ncbi:MAG TPA: alpha/beta fold hydrolase, partial [Ilumatobacteraceae bacterium]
MIPGAEPWSHDAGRHDAGGIVLVHGFGGTPATFRRIAVACAGAGLHVEVPLLPGHGTQVSDMVPTRWRDWTGEASNAYQRAATRSSKVVLGGQSMGASLALWIALGHP